MTVDNIDAPATADAPPRWTPPPPPRFTHAKPGKPASVAHALRRALAPVVELGLADVVAEPLRLLDRGDELTAEAARLRGEVRDGTAATVAGLVDGSADPKTAAAALRKARERQAADADAADAVALAADTARLDALRWCRDHEQLVLGALHRVVADAAQQAADAVDALPDDVRDAETATRRGHGDHYGAMLRAQDRVALAWAAADLLDAAGAVEETAVPGVVPPKNAWRHLRAPQHLHGLPTQPSLGLALAQAVRVDAGPGVYSARDAWEHLADYGADNRLNHRGGPDPFTVRGLR
ncbi:MAG: hypothetical protein R2737_02030 [Candidatus Nanopelagicales bacterium]